MKKKLVRSGLLSTCLLVPAGMTRLATPAFGQVSTGSINGTVLDATGAVVPHAAVLLTNQATGDKRTINSNDSGNFTFAGIQSGDYTVTISAAGFRSFTEKGVHLDPGDSRTLPKLQLATGSSDQTVTVEGQTDVPLDTGERSDLITSEQIKHLSVEGRDVTELFKTLPGFAIQPSNGSIGNTAYDPSQVNVSGALGNYAANGNPISGITLRLDGANITDPGNFGSAIQNVNYDQVSEVKVDVSNFGADIANGPVVVSAVTRSGTNTFHGSLYTYARTAQLNSSDALNGATNQQKANDREVYPGFTIGGPVLVPGTSFNKNRNLTFFAGAEDYAQRNIYAYGGSSSALVHALVPTAAMRGGDFSAGALQSFLGPNLCTAPTSASNTVPNSPCAAGTYQNIAIVPTVAKDGSAIVNGQIPKQFQDPGFQALFNSFPSPNSVPTVANPYNWQAQDFINDDLWQAIGRVDLQISQRNHFFARYSVERGSSGEPTAVYYNPGGINTPGGGLSKVNSESAAANLTTIITPTLTNQLYGNLAYLDQAFTSSNPSALTAYPYQGAFANGRHPLPELGNYNNADGLPLSITPDYSLGPIFAHKFTPEGGDNVTKVWGKHTVVAGVYVARVTNNEQNPNTATNGAIAGIYGMPAAGVAITDLDGSTATMSGNWLANNYEGYITSYSQTNILSQPDLYFWNNDFFANDSWKIAPRLTVNYGARFEHLGLWNDAHGKGIAVFNPALISSAAATSPYPGFEWHANNPSLPLSGNTSYPLFIEPRLGFAFDVLGTGKTVLRGGWGEYRAHDSWNDASNELSVTQGSESVSETGVNSVVSLGAISKLNLNPVFNPANTSTIGISGVSGPLSSPGNLSTAPLGAFTAATLGDREQGLSDTYSLTFNQELPKHMNLLVGYVGDNSRFLLNNGSNQQVALDNINAIPVGGLYRPNPLTGQVLAPLGINPQGSTYSSYANGIGTAQTNEYRPLNTTLVQYGALDVPKHVLNANYNAFQTGLSRQTGRILFNVNYTFSHALGIQGANGTGEPSDPFNLAHDYGPETFDRRHIFNATYTFEVGNPVHNKFAGAFTNGWELSGITTFQSGPDIPALLSNPGLLLSGNLGQQYVGTNPDGTPAANPNYIPVTNTVYLGTPDVSLQPTVTCNPRSGLSAGQFANPSCFGTPNFGQNGVYQLPYLKGPNYFDSDLSAQKAFSFKSEQAITFRASAFNFLNHPLTTLTTSFNNEYTLNMTNPNATGFTQGAVSPTTGFGNLPYKTGRRVVELMAKYTF